MSLSKRTKISAAYNHFEKQVRKIRRLDSDNQKNFADGTLKSSQMNLLCESLFFAIYREFENYVRDIFILYSQEKPRSSGKKVKSYLKPKNFFHAEKMMKSSMNFLDWNSPDQIIERSELYLKDGFPIKHPFTTNLTRMRDYKKIRNHIAHNSLESFRGFKVVVRRYYGVDPIPFPDVGSYLQLTSRADPTKYHLLEAIDSLESMAISLK